MSLKKYRVLIVITFLGIFASKMVITAAPVFFAQLDKDLMHAVIMQLEVENNTDDASKGSVKFLDHKLTSPRFDFTAQLIADDPTANSFIEHSRRYIDPYHPSVPTPPPNFL